MAGKCPDDPIRFHGGPHLIGGDVQAVTQDTSSHTATMRPSNEFRPVVWRQPTNASKTRCQMPVPPSAIRTGTDTMTSGAPHR